MAEYSKKGITGDFWGGLAAMLVALPSAIAFGVIIFSAIGASFGAQGAMAGILGATALGLVASAFGGTKRLISAPCAPAAAVLSAIAINFVSRGLPATEIILMLSLIGAIGGLMQVLFGVLHLGRLIKYMPYPVVSGYLSGVGLIIILSQVPKLLGTPKGTEFSHAMSSPSMWQWQSITVGTMTIIVMLAAPLLTKTVPAAILALIAGVLTYFGLGFIDSSLWSLTGNTFVIGSLGGSQSGFLENLTIHWKAIGTMGNIDFYELLVPAATIAVLLSIDTLKTCVVLDTITRSRHNSNRELIGQGLGNITSSAIGGIPGAGTMGATLINLSSGGQSSMSGIIEGALSLGALIALGPLIAWVPIPALAAILIVIGIRMFDRQSLHLLKARSTVLDFAVIVAVVVVAESVSLIAASATGIVLAIMLFIREQVRSSSLRRKTYGNQMFSKRVRLPEERAILEERGARTVIFELQGSLFFGTADQLYTAMEPELKTRTYVILDMRRIQFLDVTAAHVLEVLEDSLAQRGAFLIFSQLPRQLPTGQDMRRYFDQVGLVKPESHARVFPELDDALAWVEDRILAEARAEPPAETPLELREIEIFKKRKEETIALLEACMDKKSLKNGERIFSLGDKGDELYLIRRGSVRIEMPMGVGHKHHIFTFGRGDFFGEMAFLDQNERSADALAVGETELFVLSRKRFDALAAEHRKLAANLFEGLARVLSIRLRHTNTELRLLQES